MKTTTVSRLQFPSWSGLVARVPDFIVLMKPRVMVLAVFTAAVGLFIAPGDLNPLLGAVSIVGIAAGAGAAGVLNMWYDADIDARARSGVPSLTAKSHGPKRLGSGSPSRAVQSPFSLWRSTSQLRRCSGSRSSST